MSDTKTPEPHRVTAENAPRIWEWLQTRGGLALWASIDLSDPGKTWTAPYLDSQGQVKAKEHWKMAGEPYRIITDPAEVVVEQLREVDRFPVRVRAGSQGLVLKLTDGSSRNLRKRMARANKKHRPQEEDASYEFDYMTQEAVIYVPDQLIPLAEYMAAQGQPHVG